MLELLNSQTALGILGYLLLSGLLNLLLGKRSQVDAWAEKRPYLAAVLKALRGVGFDPWVIVQALTLATKKRLPLAMQTPELEAKAEQRGRSEIPPPRKGPPSDPPMGGMVAMLALCLLLGSPLGCNTAVNWPAVAKCVPTEEIGRDIVDKITDILLRGGDYQQALEDLARQYGADGPRMVICVVNALLGDWTDTSKPQAGPDKAAAVVRARAFLKRAGTRVEPAP